MKSIIKNDWLIFGAILLVFVLFRLPSVHAPYHQDEYKWVLFAHPEIFAPGSVPHPPLTEFIYTRLGPVIGENNLRVIPFAFSIANLFLIYLLARILFKDRKLIFLALSIFAISFYSVLASLMVDVDGAVMPLFFLLMAIGYFKLKDSGWRDHRWLPLLLVGAIGGFMIKLSAILPILAFALDFAIDMRVFSDKKRLIKYFLGIVGTIIFFVLLLLGAKFVFPFFNLEYSMKYWEHFANSSSFLGRGWFQTMIQCIKAIFYASPLLILAPFFGGKEMLIRLRPFLYFLGFAFLFYVVLFDFSIGALDRYWELLVIPLSLCAGAAICGVFGDEVRKPSESTKIYFLMGCTAALAISLVQFMPHFLPPLHPKSEWIGRIFSLHWNFLYPFHGGSGPLCFYVSFLFIGLSWLVSTLVLVAAYIKPAHKKHLFAFFIPVALMYNLVFIEEYHFGVINGSAPKLLSGAIEFIKNDPDITQVLTYNDTGGFPLQQVGKYQGRLYIFGTDTKIKNATGYYFELDAPRPPLGAYKEYLDTCKVLYRETDRKITATVYDCRTASR